MSRYYTRVCNFYYGKQSKKLVKKKKTLALNGNDKISFDEIEIYSRKSIKKISIKSIQNLQINLKKKIKKDLKVILEPNQNIFNLN